MLSQDVGSTGNVGIGREASMPPAGQRPRIRILCPGVGSTDRGSTAGGRNGDSVVGHARSSGRSNSSGQGSARKNDLGVCKSTNIHGNHKTVNGRQRVAGTGVRG